MNIENGQLASQIMFKRTVRDSLMNIRTICLMCKCGERGVEPDHLSVIQTAHLSGQETELRLCRCVFSEDILAGVIIIVISSKGCLFKGQELALGVRTFMSNSLGHAGVT